MHNQMIVDPGTQSVPGRTGFSLLELAVVVAIFAITGAAMLPTMQHVRSNAFDTQSQLNLMALGQASSMYKDDHADRIFTFSWMGGEIYFNPKNGNPRRAADDWQASSWQAQDIVIRTHAMSKNPRPAFTSPDRIRVHRRYTHLVLADYLGLSEGGTNSPIFVDPADESLIAWRSDPFAYDENRWESGFPYAGTPDEGSNPDPNLEARGTVNMFAYGSSYQVVPHAWTGDGDSSDSFLHPVEQTQSLFASSGGPVQLSNGRRYSEVRFPANRVHMYEEFDREFFVDAYFGYDFAQPAKLMFDGSINTLASGMANPSVSPLQTSPVLQEWRQRYLRLDKFPPPVFGDFDNTPLSQRWRWTFRGLKGFDFAPRAFPGPQRAALPKGVEGPE